ncbi:hypothetical protein H4Q26_004105 [Puccinia striiformis f. sp. tritici PST-130]|nr:hypothetical protein H4Q26_004105 [Puccinia striiformis f. sp. tritici PST-130]
MDLSRHYSPHQVMKAPIHIRPNSPANQVNLAELCSVKHSNRQKQHTNNLVPPNQSTPTSRESTTPAKTCPASQHLLLSVYVAIKTVTIFCVLCGTRSPMLLVGNLCQDCSSLTASPASLPVPNTAPPPTSLSNLANTQRIKREEAIQRVQAMYTTTVPVAAIQPLPVSMQVVNPGRNAGERLNSTPKFPSRITNAIFPIAPPPGTMLAPASKAPYLNARAQRLAACKPYQSCRAGSVKQDQSTIPQGNLGVRERVPVNLTGQESLSNLLNDLQRFTRKGGYVRDRDALLDHLTKSKTIDLILDYDAFNEDDLDKQEEAIIARKEGRSLTTTIIIGHGSSTDSGPAATPLVLSTAPSTTSQCNHTFQSNLLLLFLTLNVTPQAMLFYKDHTCPLISLRKIAAPQHYLPSTKLERRYAPNYANYPMSHPGPLGIGNIRPGPIVPPWIAKPILDFDDLSWSVLEPKKSLAGTARICRYKLDYSNGHLNSHQGKTLPAKLYEGGRIYDMVAEFSLIERDLWTDSYTTEPNYAMRTYAMARQFMYLFTNIMGSSDAGPELKFWSNYLRVVDTFPFPDDAPEGVFFMQERIRDFLPLLDPAAEDYFMTDSSPAPEKLLHAFQHYLYEHTNGQMTMTGFWGNPPLISRPHILDLNKKATWSRDGTDVRAMHLDFIAKHICTNACKAVDLSTLVEIPWPPAKPKDESVVEAKPTTQSNNTEEKPAGSKNTRMESEDIELLEIVRQGHQVLAQRHA